MAVTDAVNSVLNSHQRINSLQFVQFVALVSGAGYRLAMFNPRINSV